MTTWFTADLHFGHHNIIEYCSRPFADVDHMNRRLIDNWNAVVGAADTVWVLGDFALGKITETLALTTQLSGRKILVAGNHDRCWFGHGERCEPWVDRYLEAGFAEIVQGTTTLRIGDVDAVLCHFPYRGDSHDDDRFVEHRPVDDGAWLVHGHVHDQWAKEDRMVNVGVDARSYAPISEAALAAELTHR
ncbi:MAG: calcineurin-like phosphoesterase family protein [Candidatus Aldehydirespiratoraceae bacterium]|jgi:calcineurin-like phosphoesterase family protein